MNGRRAGHRYKYRVFPYHVLLAAQRFLFRALSILPRQGWTRRFVSDLKLDSFTRRGGSRLYLAFDCKFGGSAHVRAAPLFVWSKGKIWDASFSLSNARGRAEEKLTYTVQWKEQRSRRQSVVTEEGR